MYPVLMAGQFSPQNLPGIVGWWDASDTATITASSGAVSSWASKVGTYAATQSTAAYKPTTNATTLNGRNIITFDGTNDILTVSSFTISKAQTVFSVVNTTDNSPRIVYEHGADFNSNPGQILNINNASTWMAGYQTSTGASGGSAKSFATRTSGAHQLTTQINLTHASNSLWQDGTALTGTNTAYTVDQPGSVTAPLYIGSRSTLAARWLGGIAELIFCNAVLSTADRQATEAYLKAKWGTP